MKKTEAPAGGAYREMVGDKIHDYVAAIEMDGGAEKPAGFGVSPGGAALARLKEIGPLLAPIGADTIRDGGGGADIAPLMHDGVPGLGLVYDRTTLFRLAPHAHGHCRQNQSARFPAMHSRHGRDELRDRRHARPSGRIA